MTSPTLRVARGIILVQWCVATCTDITENELPDEEPKHRYYRVEIQTI